MNPLHEQLEQLLHDVPSAVHADVDGAAREGARRRARRQVTTGALGALVVLVAALSVLVLPGAPDHDGPAGTRPTVEGHPTHVRTQGRHAPLPEAPGPVAGVVQAFPGDAWTVVSPTGRTWRAPGSRAVQPALSPDGTRLAYASRGELVVRDLVSGAVVRTGVQAARPSSGRWGVDEDSTLRWAPDSRSLALLADRTGTRGSHLVVWPGNGLVDLGRATLLPGWSARTSVVALDRVGRTDDYLAAAYRVASRGRVVREAARPTVRLVDGPLRNEVSLDDQGRLVVLGRAITASASLTTYDLTTGRLVSRLRRVPGPFAVGCQWGSDGTSPAYLSNDDYRSDRQRGALVTATGKRLVAFDPGGSIWCAALAADALRGDPHEDLAAQALGTVGLEDTWVYWRSRELLLGLLVVGLLPLLAAARWRRSPGASWPADGLLCGAVTAAVTSTLVRDATVPRATAAHVVVDLLPAGLLLALLWAVPAHRRPLLRLTAAAVALLALVDVGGELWPLVAGFGAVLTVVALVWRPVRRDLRG